MPNEHVSILIVDDVPDNLKLLSNLLANQGAKVRPAPNGERALATIAKLKPDLILLDIMMPDMDGYEVCRRLKAQEDTRDIPIIFLSALDTPDDRIMALKMGGVDYISKPFQAEEVLARVNTHLTIRAQQQTLMRQNEELREKNEMITRQAQQLELLATRDCLTELANRRYFLERLEQEERRFRRNSGPFSLIMLDIDYFKAINDTYGHECGDVVLKGVARALESNLRAQDLVARWGGEEFICLLPETDSAGARRVAEKMRQTVADLPHPCGDQTIKVSVTLGVSQFEDVCSPDECIRRADTALYEGKRLGRNRVMVTGEGRS